MYIVTARTKQRKPDERVHLAHAARLHQRHSDFDEMPPKAKWSPELILQPGKRKEKEEKKKEERRRLRSGRVSFDDKIQGHGKPKIKNKIKRRKRKILRQQKS